MGDKEKAADEEPCGHRILLHGFCLFYKNIPARGLLPHFFLMLWFRGIRGFLFPYVFLSPLM
jgi:hypothetical protein